MNTAVGMDPGSNGWTLVGFDVRVSLNEYPAGIWPPERRAEYLLLSNVTTPLSVDKAVWPRSLQEDRGPERSGRGLNGLGLLNVTLEFDELSVHTRAARGVLIAVFTPDEVALRLNRRYGSTLFGEGEPRSLELDGWKNLGIDVADDALVSGLSNCGYEGAEIETLGSKYGPELNEYGLFTVGSTADAFCRESDQRIPEHRPFSPFLIGVRD